MSRKKKKCGGSVYEKPGYEELKAFNDNLLNENSRFGKIISSESLRLSSENIHQAVVQTIVNNGHGVMLRRVS